MVESTVVNSNQISVTWVTPQSIIDQGVSLYQIMITPLCLNGGDTRTFTATPSDPSSITLSGLGKWRLYIATLFCFRVVDVRSFNVVGFMLLHSNVKVEPSLHYLIICIWPLLDALSLYRLRVIAVICQFNVEVYNQTVQTAGGKLIPMRVTYYANDLPQSQLLQ